MDVQTLSNLANGSESNEDRIFSLLFKEDELTWQTVIYELVKTEQMDPWDISIGVIADRFITMLRKMREMDFRVGGKMILAAALLLKMKSEKLMNEDIVALDHLINNPEEGLDLLSEEPGDGNLRDYTRVPLVPRTPQPRQRKVSVYDLVEALEQALETETKKSFRSLRSQAPMVKIPEKKTDITKVIDNLYLAIKKHLSTEKTLTFDDLAPGESKEDKVITFVPLLHLDTQRKIDLRQKEHFGTINISLATPRPTKA